MIPYETALAAFKAASDELKKPWVDSPEQAECLSRLILWAIRSPEYPGRPTAGILLRGHRDGGKTHAMKCLRGMLNRLHVDERGHSRGDAFAIKVCQELATEYNIKGDEALAEMASGERVLYDDLGEERDGNFMGKHCNVMAEVLGKRYRTMQERAMLTMFTTNLPNDKATTDKYGERISTRINEMCDVIVWKGPKDGFRRTTAPLLWTWPGSPQEANVKSEEDRRRQEAFEVMRRAEKVKQDARDRAEAERKEKEWQVEFAKLTKGIGEMSLDTVVMISRSHPHPDMKQAYRAELERRTKHPIDEVNDFLNTPVIGFGDEQTMRVEHVREAEPVPTNAEEVVIPLDTPTDQPTAKENAA